MKNSIKNLVIYAKKTERFNYFTRAKFLELDQSTTSQALNEHLAKVADRFSNSTNIDQPTPAEITLATHQSLLKSACSSDADLLSYKGINLGSAINMKLAVKLGSLLSKQQG